MRRATGFPDASGPGISIFKSAQRGAWAEVRDLAGKASRDELAAAVRARDETDPEGNGLAHLLASSGPLDLLTRLVDETSEALVSRNRIQQTCLTRALLRTDAEGDAVVQFLLARGAAKTVFVAGYSADSLVVSLPMARKPTSATVALPAPAGVSKERLAAVDTALAAHVALLDLRYANTLVPDPGTLFLGSADGAPVPMPPAVPKSPAPSPSASGGGAAPAFDGFPLGGVAVGDLVVRSSGWTHSDDVDGGAGTRGVVVHVGAAPGGGMMMGPGGAIVAAPPSAPGSGARQGVHVVWLRGAAAVGATGPHVFDSSPAGRGASELQVVGNAAGTGPLRVADPVPGCRPRPGMWVETLTRIGLVVADNGEGPPEEPPAEAGGAAAVARCKCSECGSSDAFQCKSCGADPAPLLEAVACPRCATTDASDFTCMACADGVPLPPPEAGSGDAAAAADDEGPFYVHKVGGGPPGAARPPGGMFGRTFTGGAGGGAGLEARLPLASLDPLPASDPRVTPLTAPAAAAALPGLPAATAAATPAKPAVRPLDPQPGARVKRGTTWRADVHGDQDGGSPGALGTVIGPANHACSLWRVRWDASGAEFNYRWAPEHGVSDLAMATEAEEAAAAAAAARAAAAPAPAAPAPVPEASPDAAAIAARTATIYPPVLAPGDVVRRGVDWRAGASADANGALGTVVSVGVGVAASVVHVRWARGGADLCEGFYVYDPRPAAPGVGPASGRRICELERALDAVDGLGFERTPGAARAAAVARKAGKTVAAVGPLPPRGPLRPGDLVSLVVSPARVAALAGGALARKADIGIVVGPATGAPGVVRVANAVSGAVSPYPESVLALCSAQDSAEAAAAPRQVWRRLTTTETKDLKGRTVRLCRDPAVTLTSDSEQGPLGTRADAAWRGVIDSTSGPGSCTIKATEGPQAGGRWGFSNPNLEMLEEEGGAAAFGAATPSAPTGLRVGDLVAIQAPAAAGGGAAAPAAAATATGPAGVGRIVSMNAAAVAALAGAAAAAAVAAAAAKAEEEARKAAAACPWPEGEWACATCTVINASPGAKRPRGLALKCDVCGSTRAFPEEFAASAAAAVAADVAVGAAGAAAPAPPPEDPRYTVVRVLGRGADAEGAALETFSAAELERLPNFATAVAAASKSTDASAAAPRIAVNSRVVLSRCGPVSDSSRCLGGRVLGLVGTVKETKAGRVRVRRVGASGGPSSEDWYFASELALESDVCAELDALRAATPALASPLGSPARLVASALSVGAAAADSSSEAASAAGGAAAAQAAGAATAFAPAPVSAPPPPHALVRELSAAFADERTFVEVMGLPDLLRRRDTDGNSALHHAAFCGLTATFKALRAAGARSYEPSANPGWTAASLLDGVYTRAGARLHRHLTIRGALGHHRAAMLAACEACAVDAGEVVPPPPATAQRSASAATDPDFDIAWALAQIDTGSHQLALPPAQASVAQGYTDSFVVAALLFMLEGAMETARSLLTSYFLAFEGPHRDAAEVSAESPSSGSSSVAAELPRPASFAPLALYVLYLTQLDLSEKPGAPSWRRAQAADTLRAVRCFPDIAARLGEGDTLDAEVPDVEFEPDASAAAAGEADEQTAMELADERRDRDDRSGPEARWDALGASCEPMDKLMRLVGLREVKDRAIQVYLSTRVREAATGFFRGTRVNTASNSHLVLVGNPGTGKTTIARLLGAMMKAVGFRPGNYAETTGTKVLMGGVKEWRLLLKDCEGGVLFLDEAYQLHPKKGAGQAGQQVLDLLMDHAENHVATSTIIIAGYEDEVRDLMSVNAGFGSRFPPEGWFNFKDYSEVQLRAIFRAIVEEKGLLLPTRAEAGGVSVAGVVAARMARRIGVKGFGNAREARNRVDAAIKRWELRVGPAIVEAQAGKRAMSSRQYRSLTREDVLGRIPDLNNSPLLAALERMVGMSAIKAKVRAIMRKVLEDFNLEARGEKVSGLNMHGVFKGNPGTGKTTVAKIYGKLLKEWGLLSRGDLIVKTPRDMPDAQSMLAVLESAKGNVLLIDEAYNMADPSQSAGAGKGAALETLLEKMPIGPSADCSIILAGYNEQMDAMFRDGNPGLSSRFNIADPWLFEDFTDAELLSVFLSSCQVEGLAVMDSVARRAIQHTSLQRKKPAFGNARLIENMIGSGKARMLARVGQLRGEGASAAALHAASVLTIEDLVVEETSVDKARAAFADMVAVPAVQEAVDRLCRTAQMASDEGRNPSDLLSECHMVFYGPAGVGKSETARRFGRVLFNLRVLPDARVTEVLATELMGEYVGQTAPKVRALFKAAAGGVLFIDEAYGLANPTVFATEAVQTMMGLTEGEYKGKIVIILAGYKADMEAAFEVNEGLRRRYKKIVVEFGNWTAPMCAEFFLKAARKERVTLEGVPAAFSLVAQPGAPAPPTPAVVSAVLAAYGEITRHPRFSNGSCAENLYKRSYEARCERLQAEKAAALAASSASSAAGGSGGAKPRGGLAAIGGGSSSAGSLAGRPIVVADVTAALKLVLAGLGDPNDTPTIPMRWVKGPDGKIMGIRDDLMPPGPNKRKPAAPAPGAAEGAVKAAPLAPGSVHEVGSLAEFDAAVAAAGDRVVLVDFKAAWCGPCRQVAPQLDAFAKATPSVLVLSVDVDEVPELSEREGVTAMPTFLTWWRGKRTPAAARGADMRGVRTAVSQAQGAAEETLTAEAIARSMQPVAPAPAAALQLGGEPAKAVAAAEEEEDFYSSPAPAPTPAAPRAAVAPPPKAAAEAEAPPAAEAEEEAAAPAPGRVAAIGPDGVSWWVDAMADLAARTKRPVTAADMLRMCRDGSFDAGFIAFAARALGVPTAAAAEAVTEQAASEIGELEAIAKAEGEAEAAGTAMRAQGIPVIALWICGFCGNANPGCPYRPTRSGGYRIYVPEGGPLAQRYPGYNDVAAPGVGPDLRDMCQKAGFTPADTQM